MAKERMRADLTIVISTLVLTNVDIDLFAPESLHRISYALTIVPWSVTPVYIFLHDRARVTTGTATGAKTFTVIMEV